MHTAHDMTKDLMFKLRLEEKDRTRLDAIAAHYETTAAQALRTLLKEKAIALGLEPSGLAAAHAARSKFYEDQGQPVPPPPPFVPAKKSAAKKGAGR